MEWAVILVPVDEWVAVDATQLHESDGAELLHEFTERVCNDFLLKVLVCFQNDSNVVNRIAWICLENLDIDPIVADSRWDHTKQNPPWTINEYGSIKAEIDESLPFEEEKIAVG